jgi:hypothetical protein
VVVNVDWPSFTSGIVVDDGTDELGELGVEEDVLTIVETLNKGIDKIDKGHDRFPRASVH